MRRRAPRRAGSLALSIATTAATAAAMVAVVTDASAISLGTAVLDSGLGEPLRFSVPVSYNDGEEIGCVQVRARGDGLPPVFNTRAAVVRIGSQTRIEVTSAQPVGEPAVGAVVSVGCAAPVAREFVFLLDPPIAAPRLATSAAPRSVVEPTVPRGVAQRAESVAGDAGAAARPSTRPRPRRPRARPSKPTPGIAATGTATAEASAPRAAPAPVPQAPATGDRLSVAPSTGGTAAPTAPSQAGATAADADALAREQSLKQQQDALQAQIKTMGDQIAALRAQTAGLLARNQALQERAESSPPMQPSPLVWAMVVLAAIAVAIAAWLGWRYGQLKRTLEGSPWWSGNTVQAPGTIAPAMSTFNESELAAFDQGTKAVERPVVKTDARTSGVAATGAATPVAERPRAVARPSGYPHAIETDFTVSDIEAAMATVRTVSPPRRTGARPVEDSDFAPLGGPTIPSPFTQPPAPPRPAVDAGRREVDFDVPPLLVPSSPPDAPAHFDPLSTDSAKRTEVETVEPARAVDFELPATPTALDFELPTATVIRSINDAERSPRHGATALDNLFASDAGALGPDTILALEDREGAPLSTSEVDRLTGGLDGSFTATVPGDATADGAHHRLSRFAGLVDEVDDIAPTDPLRAIARLRQYVLRDETIPTLLWLRLFALYRSVGKRPVYDALAEHFARRYRRPMVGWDEALADRAPQTPLTAFPELDREIERSWGTETGLERLQALLCGRDQSDAIVFNAVLQRDLLDTAKIFLVARDPQPPAS